jgi:glucokinase
MTHKSHVIALDLGGTKIAGAVVRNGKILKKQIVPTPKDSASSVVSAMLELIQELLVFSPHARLIGVGTPGSIDHQNGIVRYAANLPGFINLPLQDMLSNQLNKTVTLENDAKAAAIAEHVYGAAKNASSSMFITISTGIGGAIIQNNRIWYGAKGIAGEIGHLKTQTAPDQFSAFEHLASGTAIARDASTVFKRPMQTKEVFELAQTGNQNALELVALAAKRIGHMIADLQLIVDPEVFVLGGGVSQAGQFFLEQITIAANNHAAGFAQVCIRQAALGTDAGMIGAAYLAEQQADDSQLLRV